MAETKTLNIYQKLAKIRDIADAVRKDKSGYGYKYADINEILAKVTGGMKKQGVSLVPMVQPGTAHTETIVQVNTKTDREGVPYDKKTTETLVMADMCFLWVNDENPEETVKVPWLIIGSQGDPSQAFGSGLTYCTRYFLCEYFQIAQPETDVDTYRSKQKEAEESEDRAVAKQIIEEVDKIVKSYLASNSDKAAEVKKFIAKYVRGSDYFKITNAELAGKLLEDFQNTYIKKGK